MKTTKVFDTEEVQYEFTPFGVSFLLKGEQEPFKVPWSVVFYAMMNALLGGRVETTLRSVKDEE